MSTHLYHSSSPRLKGHLCRGGWNDCKSQRLVRTREKHCLLDQIGPLTSWNHSSCACPHKITPVSILACGGEKLTNLYPNWEAMSSPLFLEEWGRGQSSSRIYILVGQSCQVTSHSEVYRWQKWIEMLFFYLEGREVWMDLGEVVERSSGECNNQNTLNEILKELIIQYKKKKGGFLRDEHLIGLSRKH